MFPRKSKSLPGEEDIITMPMPKKLDAAFAEITDSSGNNKYTI